MGLEQFRMYDRRKLVDCASGRVPADIVVKNGKWVCVQSGEIIPGMDFAILGNRIASISPDAGPLIGADTEIIDAAGRYVVPGLLDGHMHVESGMLTVTEFARTVIPHGTTGMFVDPHEIGNVFGIKGVKFMLDEAKIQPIHVFVQVPSCVPSAPGLETPGAVIGPEEVEEALNWEGIIGLGEVMNYPGVINNDPKMQAEIEATLKAGKTVGGHYPSPDLGLPFAAYVASGVEDDHEGTSVEDAIMRVRQGMRAMMRYGSAWHDVAVMVKAITEHGLDPRRFILCSDDSHSQTLYEEGHMDRVLRHAISQGLSPVTAIQMATINTAEHFGLSKDIGMLAPGRYADLLLVEDLVAFDVETVMAKGKLLVKQHQPVMQMPKQVRPEWVTHSIRLAREMVPSDFRLLSETDGRPIFAHVIGVIENQAPTRHLTLEMTPQNGELTQDIPGDIAKIAMIDRHHGTGKVSVGLVTGFGLDVPCAIASTVAHDCHDLIVVGTDDENMAIAVNKLHEIGGGQIVIKEGEVIGVVELPIAGLMSDEPAPVVSAQAATVLAGFKSCGCNMNNPNMQLSLLGLVVIPQLRISDLGLVDVDRFEIIPVIEEREA